jgi:hypothetical protein
LCDSTPMPFLRETPVGQFEYGRRPGPIYIQDSHGGSVMIPCARDQMIRDTGNGQAMRAFRAAVGGCEGPSAGEGWRSRPVGTRQSAIGEGRPLGSALGEPIGTIFPSDMANARASTRGFHAGRKPVSGSGFRIFIVPADVVDNSHRSEAHWEGDLILIIGPAISSETLRAARRGANLDDRSLLSPVRHAG